ncbi:hypothetical protein BGZ68_006850 [Mortierella alpina]|nr:hypothetical protein BGZ68_006850 [Mortierella alpina]
MDGGRYDEPHAEMMEGLRCKCESSKSMRDDYEFTAKTCDKIGKTTRYCWEAQIAGQRRAKYDLDTIWSERRTPIGIRLATSDVQEAYSRDSSRDV